MRDSRRTKGDAGLDIGLRMGHRSACTFGRAPHRTVATLILERANEGMFSISDTFPSVNESRTKPIAQTHPACIGRPRPAAEARRVPPSHTIKPTRANRSRLIGTDSPWTAPRTSALSRVRTPRTCQNARARPRSNASPCGRSPERLPRCRRRWSSNSRSGQMNSRGGRAAHARILRSCTTPSQVGSRTARCANDSPHGSVSHRACSGNSSTRRARSRRASATPTRRPRPSRAPAGTNRRTPPTAPDPIRRAPRRGNGRARDRRAAG